ncbi:hypothetical protein [Psychromonas sp. GE-S-Ul-11]|uniref:hypothetical protein n=1 Tax=Psychromonas sp. GE-S-Ul-11 TaxID=3241170 RepID=UPI00390C4D8D
MTLRGFGRHKSRTWYSLKPLMRKDWICLSTILVCVSLAIVKRVFEAQLFWYPFN